MEELKNVGNLTNQNSIQEEIKSSSQSGNACYHSVQKFLCSSLLPKIKMYGSTNWPVFCTGV